MSDDLKQTSHIRKLLGKQFASFSETKFISIDMSTKEQKSFKLTYLSKK